MTAPYLDQTILKRMLHYDPETGVFTWRHRDDVRSSWNTRYAGRMAGYDWFLHDHLAYRSIRIFDWPFYGHRLAWLWMTGEWPADDIDHIDMDGLNNRWENLRPATKAQNGANRRRPKDNKSGYKGVSWCNHAKKYRATIGINKRQKWLGYYDDPAEAHEAYCRAAVKQSGKYARGS